MGTQDPRDFGELLRESIASRGATGGTLSVISPDGVLSEHVVGITSVRTGIPVDSRTLFRIESHTKLVTTTVALQLCDLGLLDLDDRVVDHIDDGMFPDAFAEVTVRHLMSHQSGLPDLPSEANDALDEPIGSAARSAMTAPLLFRPGHEHSYSTTAFMVLGAVIESVTGMDWETAAREGVLRPLGMDDTCVTPEQALAHRTAIGHRFDEKAAELDVVTDTFPRGLVPTAGMFGSTTDLLRLTTLYTAVDGPLSVAQPVISAASSAAASAGERPMPAGFAPHMTQGFGWQLADWGGHRLLMHQSFGRGTAGTIMVERDTGIGYAALVNSESGESVCIDVSYAMLDSLFDVRVPTHTEPGPSGTRDLSSYTGTYTHDVYHRYVVEPTGDGRIQLRATDVYQMEEPAQAKSPLRQLDDSRFGYHSGYVLFGNFDETGAPTTLHVRNRIARRNPDQDATAALAS